VNSDTRSPEPSSIQKKALESKIYNIAEAFQISKSRDVPQVYSPDIHRKYMEENSIDSLPKVNKDEYKQCKRDLEKAGKSLEKAHIREFLSFVRPEPIIGKLFQVIGILKGYKNPNWIK
jgi:hypothetical protein